MDLVTNKTIDKLKYDLVRNNIITFEDIEKAQEVANEIGRASCRERV